MSKNYRYPVLHWQDRSGNWTTVLLEDFQDVAAYTNKPSEGEQQLKLYLQRLAKEWNGMSEPTFKGPVLQELKVSLRPEFKRRDRAVPCTYVVNLFLPMVLGEDDGLKVCILPTMDMRFYYQDQDAASLHDLALHYVRRAFGRSPPEELARFATPEKVQLGEFILRLSLRKRGNRPLRPNVPEDLKSVAEPVLGSRGGFRFPTAWEREAEVAAVRTRLANLHGGLLVIGEAGCGKSTVIAEAMRREARGRGEGAGQELNLAYWFTTAPRIIAGMRWLGQWEERCEELIADLDQVGGVLWFENLLDVIKTGGKGPRDSIASFLHPYLARNEVKLVVEATPAEVETASRMLPGFADSFERVVIPPLSPDASVRLLQALVDQLEQRHLVKAEPGVASTTHRLFNRFLPYAAFPGRASAFLASLFAQAQEVGLDVLDMQEVLNEFIQTTGLPRELVDDRIVVHYDDVLTSFRSRIIGQDDACVAAAQLVTTFKAGLQDPKRPIGVLLFCGPTGVGKTEMSKQLARAFFGGGKAVGGEAESRDERLVRLDMSEYAGFGAADRLVRKPDGSPSEFVRKMRQQPFRLVLLDEIEKADPEVFDLFLRLFDEGILHDAEGRPTNFRSSVVIMTSNLGAKSMEAVGFGDAPPQFEAAAMSFFRPEFFNRMDAVITFRALELEDVRKIARLEVERLTEREGLAERKLTLTWDEPLIDWLAVEGADRRYGARPLQRYIEEHVMVPLASELAEIPDARDVHFHLAFDATDRTDGARVRVELR